MRCASYIVALALAVGCARTPPAQSPAEAEDVDPPEHIDASFRWREHMLLVALGSYDSRFYSRIDPRPDRVATVSAPSGWDFRPYWDPFDLPHRAVSIDDVEDRLEMRHLVDARRAGEAYAKLGKGAHGSTALRWMVVDAALLDRVTAEEHARLEKEASLPRGALNLVSAIADSWPTRVAPQDEREMDVSIPWRLTQVRESLTPGSLSADERDELTREVGLVRALAHDLPATRAECETLESALAKMLTSPWPDDGDALAADVRRFVDWSFDVDAALPKLERARDAAGASVVAALDVLDAVHRAMVLDRAHDALLSSSACEARLPVASVRDLAPPDERGLACSLVHALASAKDDLSEVAALVALRDAASVAAWALTVHGPSRGAPPMPKLASPVGPEFASHVSARPLPFIAAGLAATIVLADGATAAKPRAKAWVILGEAPLDFVADWLAGKPVDAAALIAIP